MDDESPKPTTRSRRSVVFTAVGTLTVLVLTILYVVAVTYKPAYSADASAQSAVSVSTASNGQKVYTVNLNIVAQVGSGPHPDYLGYQSNTATPHPGTFFTVPRNSLVTIVVHNYDSQTALRNPFFTQVQGTIGGIEYVDGKKVKVMSPDATSHTFTIPEFNVSVPMAGLPSNAPANSYKTMKFTFRTPNRTGVFSWQCIVPCGYGLYGNGGPMSELGYMQGLITVT
ncbi:MAG: hypothetical protein NVSMB52_00410 [Chloroflexota bacterium]